MTQTETQQVEVILAQFTDSRAELIPILQEIQAQLYYLPQPALERVAEKLHITTSAVYQMATFYRCFSLKPRGKHLVQVCEGTACHVRGAQRILDRVELETGAHPGSVSPDFEFTVEPVRCLGCCALAPVMRVDRETHAHLDQGKVRGVLNRYRPRKPRKPAEEKVEEPAHASADD